MTRDERNAVIDECATALIREVRLLREALPLVLKELRDAAGPADASECFASYDILDEMLSPTRKLGETP